MNKPIDGQMKEDRVTTYAGPSHQIDLIFHWTDQGITHRSPMNPTVKKRIDLQVSLQQLKTQKGGTANFLTREDNSRDLLGKFHKDRSVWIRARRRGYNASPINSLVRYNSNNGAY